MMATIHVELNVDMLYAMLLAWVMFYSMEVMLLN